MRHVLPAGALVALVTAGVLSIAPGGGPTGGPECARAADAGSAQVEGRQACRQACLSSRGFRSVGLRGGTRLGVRLRRRVRRAATVEVFRVATPTRVTRTRRVARFRGLRRSFSWRPRRLAAGFYAVRFRVRTGRRRVDERTLAFQRVRSRFVRRKDFRRGPSCDSLSTFAIDRPAFAGRGGQRLRVDVRLRDPSRVGLVVKRGRRTLRRVRSRRRAPGRTLRFRFSPRGMPRGDVRVLVTARPTGRRAIRSSLVARRLP